MKQDMNRLLIEATIHRILQDIEQSPERAVRNLVDLGLEFSNGRFQKQLLSTAQRMLRSQNSAYYTLVKNIVRWVDPDHLTTFGVNLGYNSCTRGARRIREIEAAEGFNIPWSLSLVLDSDVLARQPDFYPDVLRQGQELGIYTYQLAAPGDPLTALPLVRGAPDCAFVLFLPGAQVTPELVCQAAGLPHLAFAVQDDGCLPQACRLLREGGRLYAAVLRYTSADRDRILDDSWLGSVMPLLPAAAVLQADGPLPQALEEEIYRHTCAVRGSQQYPAAFIDLRQDSLAIDRIISDGECAAGFGPDGQLHTYRGVRPEQRFSLFANPLEAVLRALQAES